MKKQPHQSLDTNSFKLLWSTRKFLVLAVAIGGLTVLIGLVTANLVTQGVLTAWNDLGEVGKMKLRSEAKLSELQKLEQSPDISYQEIVESALPTKKPLLELIQSLSLASQQTQVGIGQFSLAPGLLASGSAGLSDAKQSKVNGAFVLASAYNVRGTFAQLSAFLKLIEQLSPFTTVTNLVISGKISHVDQNEQFQAKVGSETYYYNQSVSSKIGDALPTLGPESKAALEAIKQYSVIIPLLQTEIQGGGSDSFFEDATQNIP